MIDPKQFAESTLQLLQANPANYRNFGTHWYFVKEVLKRYYTADNLSMLGDYRDQSVIDRMPAHASLQDALAGAVAEYRENATFGMGSTTLSDHDGESFVLNDPDAGL